MHETCYAGFKQQNVNGRVFFVDYCSYWSYSDSDTLDIVFVVLIYHLLLAPCDFLINSSLTHCLITFICLFIIFVFNSFIYNFFKFCNG